MLPDHGPASVLLPGGARGAAFLIFRNFQVIERYNAADAYVIGVGHLADRLKVKLVRVDLETRKMDLVPVEK